MTVKPDRYSFGTVVKQVSMPFMTEDRVRWLAICEEAAERYDPEYYQKWLEHIRPASTDVERIARAPFAFGQIPYRLYQSDDFVSKGFIRTIEQP